MKTNCSLELHNKNLLQVAVLMACHNRKELTIRCLQSLYASVPSNWKIRVYLVDDGSKDGTTKAVWENFPEVKITKGPGNWYWAHSMFQAEISIDKPYDAILWLNDDVTIFENGLYQIEKYRSLHPSCILVGQMSKSDHTSLSYGGYIKYDRHPFHLKTLFARNDVLAADTFNGNFVIIPKSISDLVGSIDGSFAHAYADIDYGLRALSCGVAIRLVPGFIGECDENFSNKHFSRIDKLKFIFSKKGIPFGSQIRFLRRHGGIEWPIYLFLPIIKAFVGK